jgi:hypothetical protein
MSFVNDYSLTAEVDMRFDELFGEDGTNNEQTPDTEQTLLSKTHLLDLKSIVLSIDWEITDGAMTGLLNEIKKVSDLYAGNRSLYSMLRLLESLAKYIRKRKGRAHPDSIQLLNSCYRGLETIVTGENLSKEDVRAIVSGEIDKFRRLKSEIATRRLGPRKLQPGPVAATGPADSDEKSDRSEEPVRVRLEETLPYHELDESARRVVLKAEEAFQASKSENNGEPEEPDKEDAQPREAAGETTKAPFTLDEIKPPKDLAEMTPHEAFAFALEEVKATIQAEFRTLKAELKMWRMNG